MKKMKGGRQGRRKGAMEESMHFDSQFRRFQLMVSYCIALGPVMRQHITVGIAVEECVTS